MNNEKLETLKSLYLDLLDETDEEATKQKRELLEKITNSFSNIIPKDNGLIFHSGDNITRQLTKYAHPLVNLNNQETTEQRAVVCVDLMDAKTNTPIKTPFSLYEKAVIQAVFSLIHAGNVSFTGAQLYRKMRGNSSAKPTEKALNDLHEVLMKLQSVRLHISCTDANGNKSKEAIKILGFESVNYPLFVFQAGKGKANEILVKGKIPQWSYTLWAKPNLKTGAVDYCPFLTLQIKLNQYNELKDDLLQIKNDNGKPVQLTNDRLSIVQCLLDFVITFNRASGNLTNKKPYEDIFKQCKIKITHAQQEKRFKEFILIVMNHFQNNGLIKEFSEYNNGRGVEIRTAKKPAKNQQKKKALSTGNR